MAVAGVLYKMIGFLRAGYPVDISSVGYIPLLALLPRRLTEDDVATAATDLGAGGCAPIEEIDIGVAVTKVTGELPSDVDTGRIKHLLNVRGLAVSTRRPSAP